MANPLHEAFDWVFRKLMPEAPDEAIVYEVDAGSPESPNVTITAGVFEGDTEPTGAMIAGPFVKTVSKAWLAEQAARHDPRV